MPSFQQMLADDRIGAEAITLQLSPDTTNPTAGLPVVVNVDYSNVGEEGVALPLAIQVTKPNGEVQLLREFSRMLPSSFDFTPVDAGPHLVRIFETNHNRAFGTLELEVAGDDKVSQ